MSNFVPNEDACKILSSTWKSEALVVAKVHEISASILKILKFKQAAKFGLSSVGGVGSELVSIIGTVAAKVAQNVLGDISKLASKYMEIILASFMQMFLVSPTAILSLVSIPHGLAKDAIRDERIYLLKAKSNLNNIMFLILKWLKGFSSTSNTDKMQRALPYIIRAIQDGEVLIKDLNNRTRPLGKSRNAVFNESIYTDLKSNLDQAIKISTPDSLLVKQAEIDSRLESRKSKLFSVKSLKITAEYVKRNKDLTKWFNDQMASIRKDNKSQTHGQNTDESNQASLQTKKEKELTAEYAEKLKSLSISKKIKLAQAIVDSKNEAEKLMNQVTNNLRIGVDELFALDIKKIKHELYELVENTKRAFLKYKEYQLYCNNIYDMRGLILSLIKEMISMIRSVGNAGSEVILSALNSADTLMKVARDIFQDSIDEKRSGKIASAKISMNLLLGNTSLVAADSALDATVTRSLIDLINADDVLSDQDKKYEQLLVRLADIRDWDGRFGVWAVDMAQGTASPYIQLVADCVTLMSQVPILCFVRSEENNERMRLLGKNINEVFGTLLNHNLIVLSTLESYSPYKTSELGDLKKLLNSAGLLQSFAMSMSILTLVSGIIASFKGSFFSPDATVEHCMKEYPELFTDPDIIKYAAISRQNFPAKEFYNETQADNEKYEYDRTGVKLLLDTTNYLKRRAEDTLH